MLPDYLYLYLPCYLTTCNYLPRYLTTCTPQVTAQCLSAPRWAVGSGWRGSYSQGSIHPALYTLHLTLYTVTCTLYTTYCTPGNVHCTIYTILHTAQAMLTTEYLICTFYSLPSFSIYSIFSHVWLSLWVIMQNISISYSL